MPIVGGGIPLLDGSGSRPRTPDRLDVGFEDLLHGNFHVGLCLNARLISYGLRQETDA